MRGGDIDHIEQLLLDARLAFPCVHDSMGDCLGADGRFQRLTIDDWAARGIDEYAVGFQFLEKR